MEILVEPMMSLLLAASLGAIAATATVRFSITDKSCAVVAGLVWLATMKVYYTGWNVDPKWGVLGFFGPIGLIAAAVDEIVTVGQVLLGILVLAKAFGSTLKFLAG